MNSKIINTLEFNKIQNILINYAITDMAKETIKKLAPSSNILEVQKSQNETTEATNYLLRQQDIPLSPISDLKQIFYKMKLGGFLNIIELLKIADVLRISRKLKNSFFSDSSKESDFPLLSEYFSNLYINQKVEEEIMRCIKNEEELDDRASSDLYKIRTEIKNSESKIKDKLNSILHSKSKFLQDTVITFRNDRYVVPVKQEYRNEIQGLIHDESATGSTIFVEPTTIFNLNNEIKELKIKESLEIDRILLLLTSMCAPIAENLEICIEQIAKIDFAFAKGKYSLSINGFSPIFDSFCNLKNARHPLIDENKVVPIDIWIGKEFNSLIITGPNTGGKTVTLKTVGLLCMMAQSGLHIPCKEGSTLKLFNEIYTDIGDEQSIEQSLSTFSGHIKNITSILDNVTSDDLVLIDEIGSGTDPIEGAAIAMSILEYLHNINCFSITTTHYSELKSFAIKTNGISNASCEFDVDTLRPTYKLLIGIPGKSNAFEISKKLGLKSSILKRATEFINTENVKFEDILSELELNKRKALEERESSLKLLKEAEITKSKIEEEKNKLEKQKNEILSKAKKEARDILIDANEQANDIIKDLTNINIEKKNAFKEAEDKRNELKKSILDIQKELATPNSNNSINAIDKKDIVPGMQVYVPSLEQEATICKLPDKKDNVQIQSGVIKLNIHISQLEKSKDSKKNNNPKKASKTINKTKDIQTEIMLIGMTASEAIPTLDKYLDDSYLASIGSVRVVHGKGTGALRKAIWQYLKTNPHVKSFRQGMYGEGDYGVTIVELK